MTTSLFNKPRGRGLGRPFIDHTGSKYGRLTAVSISCRENGKTMWFFSCECGNIAEAPIKSVLSGNTQSCGCLAREVVVARNSTHGLSRKHPTEYRSWKDMRARCSNPRNDDYADYGGRGIRVCAEWNDFAVFYKAMGDRPDGATLDRIDVNGNYDPANCRWADAIEQANNKRNNHIIQHQGQSRTLAEWCKIFDIEPSKVRYRLKQGWSFDRAFSANDYRGAKP
jgi:hypothetical protein